MPNFEDNYYNPYVLNNDFLSDVVSYGSVRSGEYNQYDLRQKRQLDSNKAGIPADWAAKKDGESFSYKDSTGKDLNVNKRDGEYFVGNNKIDSSGQYNKGFTGNSIKSGVTSFFKDKENQKSLMFDTLGVVGAASNRSYMRKALRDQARRKDDGYMNTSYNDEYLGFAESNYGQAGMEYGEEAPQEPQDDTYGQWDYYTAPEEAPEERQQSMFNPDDLPDHSEDYLDDDFWEEPITLEGDALFERDAYREKAETTQVGGVAGGKKYFDAVNYMKHKGYSDEAAHGIAANLLAESGFNTSAIGDGGKAKGMAQWHPDRYNKLRNKFDMSGFYSQLDALDFELKNSERPAYEALQKARSAEEATDAFQNLFERPANQRLGARYKYLNK